MIHLHKAAHAVIPKRGQTGSALTVHVDSVGCHDDGLWSIIVCNQDPDGVVPKANGVGHHPKQDICNEHMEVKGQLSGFGVPPGALLIIHVDLTVGTHGFGSQSDGHSLEADVTVIHLHPGPEGRSQSEGRVKVDLSQVRVQTRACNTTVQQSKQR